MEHLDIRLYNSAKESIRQIEEHLSASISNTSYTHVHSSDLESAAKREIDKIWAEKLMPLVEKGFRPACLDYYHKLEKENPSAAYFYVKEYRELHPGDKLVENIGTRAIAGQILIGMFK